VELVIRSAVLFAFLWLVLRAMGKRELAQLNPFELVLLIVLGDLVQQAVTLEDHSLIGAGVIVSTLALLTVFTSWLSLRSRWFARLFEGVPTPVWRDGRPVERTMRLERIRMDELVAEARKQGISDMEDVYLATLEEDGTISFLRVDEDAGGGGQDPAAKSVV
jgi:uncharacterized membrane protein YcaP (DUF421 family)